MLKQNIINNDNDTDNGNTVDNDDNDTVDNDDN